MVINSKLGPASASPGLLLNGACRKFSLPYFPASDRTGTQAKRNKKMQKKNIKEILNFKLICYFLLSYIACFV